MENKQVDKKLQEFKKVVKHFRKKSLQSAEDIHTLRIKCRELFSLLSKDDTLAKSVKKVISLSNEIRDIDVFFSDYLAALPKKQRKKAQEEIASKAKDDGREKEIKKLHKYLKNLKIPKSIEQKIQEETEQNLVAMEFPKLHKKKLHKYRIYIKKKLYIEKNSSVENEKKIKILTDVKDILGAINDNYNGLKRLESYDIKESLYEKIKKFTQKENRKLYESVATISQ
ncbi:CHAD domain-containing protein [Sulfurimonas sp.]|uniref:CHAD domain-containing protein n=1 Tax=Sulfurimonas sp. TaxID=2022749 RepID=UPI0026216B99|nr:CHAD domain-containing protein [Sulfurimonas sp.]MDD3855833.1 CHAD domain-containing protein [Sulfurimonas sp.]